MDESKKRRVVIVRDPFADEPKDAGDTVGLPFIQHRRYSFGADNSMTPEEQSAYAAKVRAEGGFAERLFGYAHGGLDISLTVEPTWWHYAWDGGPIGHWIATRSDLINVLGEDAAADPETVLEAVKGSLHDYRCWLSGNNWRAIVEEKNEAGEWEEVDYNSFYSLEPKKVVAGEWPGVKIVEEEY